jgi:outer membrane lipoprotein carrier protein
MDLKTINGNFTQTLTSPDEDIITYEGSIFLNLNGKALWRYSSPTPKEVYVNGKSVVVVEPLLEQAIVAKIDSTFDINSLLKEQIENGKKVVVYDGISYEVTFNDFKPKTISYVDQMENRVKILFENVELNGDFDASVFTPNIPKEFDIIKN